MSTRRAQSLASTLSERRRQLATRLNLHLLITGALLLLDLVLAVGLLLAWHRSLGIPPEQLASDRIRLKTLSLEMAPLAGLPAKVTTARTDIVTFYGKRIPSSYSAIASTLGDIAVENNVRLTRVQYTQTPAEADLAEIRLDTALTGDYTAIMKFLNGVERSKNFFVVRALALTGQQGGQVSLRMRVDTWLRAADAGPATPADQPTELPTGQPGQQTAAAPEGGR